MTAHYYFDVGYMNPVHLARARIGRGKIICVDDHGVEDFGVVYARSGLHLTPVPVEKDPSVGQYTTCRGAYIFAKGEDGRKAVILHFRIP
jgi:hypothetical protein